MKYNISVTGSAMIVFLPILFVIFSVLGTAYPSMAFITGFTIWLFANPCTFGLWQKHPIFSKWMLGIDLTVMTSMMCIIYYIDTIGESAFLFCIYSTCIWGIGISLYTIILYFFIHTESAILKAKEKVFDIEVVGGTAATLLAFICALRLYCAT